MLQATVWAFFNQHADGHWRIRERVTVVTAVRQAASLAETVCYDAECSKDATFIESAAALRAVLAQLQREHGFEPPTDPGLRFLRKGLASAEGYLAWPTSGGKAAEPFWSSLFGTEAQALDLVHWRVPPAGGSCIPVRLGEMEAPDLEAGVLSWRPGGGVERYVFDVLCGLTFVTWLWPTAMREQLRRQPTFPDYVGWTLVVAAGRCAFAEEALGGLLKSCDAVPLACFPPDGTCEMADELWDRRRRRRSVSRDGRKPAEALTPEGRAVEFELGEAEELPPICTSVAHTGLGWCAWPTAQLLAPVMAPTMAPAKASAMAPAMALAMASPMAPQMAVPIWGMAWTNAQLLITNFPHHQAWITLRRLPRERCQGAKLLPNS